MPFHPIAVEPLGHVDAARLFITFLQVCPAWTRTAPSSCAVVPSACVRQSGLLLPSVRIACCYCVRLSLAVSCAGFRQTGYGTRMVA